MMIRPYCAGKLEATMATDAEKVGSLRERAWAIYDADIKHPVEPEHNGKYLVLNVETGYYEIDERLGQADERILAKYQYAKGTKPPHFAFRIGYPTTFNERP